jgi:hypothetical protein
VTTVPADELTSADGSWVLLWDGASHWGTTATARDGFQLVEYNALGVPMRTVTVDPMAAYPYPLDVEMFLVGSTFVLEYLGTTTGGLPYQHRLVVWEP